MPPNHSYNHFQAKSSTIVQQHRGWHTTRYWSESGAQGALFQTHQATATTSTPFNPPTTAAPTICSTVGNTRSGGAQSVAEKSHREMSRPRRLLQLPFYHPQNIWWMANHHQPEEVEQTPTDSAFQNGISILGQGRPPQRGLDGQVGSSGCLPYSTWMKHC